MSAVLITRIELTSAQLRAAEGRMKDARAARRMLALVLAGPPAGRRRKPAEWTARRCGEAEPETVQWTVSPTNGCTAIMPKGWRDWRTGGCTLTRIWARRGTRPGRSAMPVIAGPAGSGRSARQARWRQAASCPAPPRQR